MHDERIEGHYGVLEFFRDFMRRAFGDKVQVESKIHPPPKRGDEPYCGSIRCRAPSGSRATSTYTVPASLQKLRARAELMAQRMEKSNGSDVRSL